MNVQGDFNKGDVIELVTAEGDNIIGKGVVNYSSQEIERFINLHKQNPQMFKLQGVDVIILRERMALTKGPS